jgi:hypothetical protein
MVYKMYRKLPSGKWKYTDAFRSTLDPRYHELINDFREDEIEWELRDSEGNVKFKSKMK